MSYQITTAPTTEPLTVQEAKLWTRIDATEEDTLISELISSARQWIERQWDVALVDQTVKEYWDEVPSTEILKLTVRPVGLAADVTAIEYYDEDNALQTWATSNYTVTTDGNEACVTLTEDASWPTMYVRSGALIVTYTAGFGATAASVPAAIKTCIRMAVWDFYENRGRTPASKTIDRMEALLNPYIYRRA